MRDPGRNLRQQAAAIIESWSSLLKKPLHCFVAWKMPLSAPIQTAREEIAVTTAQTLQRRLISVTLALSRLCEHQSVGDFLQV